MEKPDWFLSLLLTIEWEKVFSERIMPDPQIRFVTSRDFLTLSGRIIFISDEGTRRVFYKYVLWSYISSHEFLQFWLIHTPHTSQLCVCVCVCARAHARTRRVPWWVLPWGPCRSWSLSGCTPRPCAPGCFEMASSWNQATSPQRSTPFTLIPSQSQHPCSLLLPYLVSWFYVCVCACMHECLHVQLFLIPWIIAHQAPLSMGFSSQEYWSVLPFPPPGDFPSPGIEPCSPVSPALASRSLTIMPPEKPLILLICP